MPPPSKPQLQNLFEVTAKFDGGLVQDLCQSSGRIDNKRLMAVSTRPADDFSIRQGHALFSRKTKSQKGSQQPSVISSINNLSCDQDEYNALKGFTIKQKTLNYFLNNFQVWGLSLKHHTYEQGDHGGFPIDQIDNPVILIGGIIQMLNSGKDNILPLKLIAWDIPDDEPLTRDISEHTPYNDDTRTLIPRPLENIDTVSGDRIREFINRHCRSVLTPVLIGRICVVPNQGFEDADENVFDPVIQDCITAWSSITKRFIKQEEFQVLDSYLEAAYHTLKASVSHLPPDQLKWIVTYQSIHAFKILTTYKLADDEKVNKDLFYSFNTHCDAIKLTVFERTDRVIGKSVRGGAPGMEFDIMVEGR